jgi:hypothetical protein
MIERQLQMLATVAIGFVLGEFTMVIAAALFVLGLVLVHRGDLSGVMSFSERLHSHREETEQRQSEGFMCRNWTHPRDFRGHTWVSHASVTGPRALAQEIVRWIIWPQLWFFLAGALGVLLVERFQ